MTTETLTAPPIYTVSGVGPYAIDHEYQGAAEFQVLVQEDEGYTTLTETDYAISPDGPAASGNLTLAGTAATTHADKKLVIQRDTRIEQGWVGQNGARETGLEVQLDRAVQAVQDGKRRLLGAIFRSPFDTWPGILPPISAGRALTAKADGTGVEWGASVGEIQNAAGNAAIAAAAAEAAGARRDEAETAAAASAAAAASVQPYASRAAAAAAVVPAVVRRLFVACAWGVLAFVPSADCQALTTNGGALHWAPDLALHNGSYVDHWIENETPGTTSVTAGEQALIDWADSLDGTGLTGQPGIRMLYGPAMYNHDATARVPSTLDGLGLEGPAKGAVLQTANGIPILEFGDEVLWSGDDTAASGPGYGQRVNNLLFANISNTANAIAIRMGRCPASKFEDLIFFGFDVAIDGYRMNQSQIDGCMFYSGQRSSSATAFIRLQGVYDSSNSHTPGGGLHITQCDFIGNAGGVQVTAILVHTVDGLYMSQNHAHFILYGLQCETLNTPQNNKITDVQVDHFYFDDPLPGGVNVRLVGTVSSGGAAGNGMYQNFSFTQCLFRGAFDANYGIVVSVTDGGGFFADRGPIRDVVLNGGELRQHAVNAISALGYTDGMIGCELSCDQVVFDEGNSGGGAATAYVKWEGIYVSLTSCKFGPVVNVTARAVHLILSDDQGTPSYIVQGNDFSRCGCSTRVFYDKRAACRGTAAGNNAAGRGERREEQASAATVNYDGKVLWSYDFQLDNETVRVTIEADSTATDGSDHHAGYDCRAVFRRHDDSSIEELRRTTDLQQTTLLDNLRPMQLVMMTGQPWVADMALAVGDIVVNGGNVYLVILSDGFAGAEGPTTTLGAQLYQGVRYLYLGPENTSRLALVVSGQGGVSLYHQADILLKTVA